MVPVTRETNIVIAVEVTQEIGLATLYSAIPEGIDTDEKARQDLVERASALVRRLATRCVLRCSCFCPSGA